MLSYKQLSCFTELSKRLINREVYIVECNDGFNVLQILQVVYLNATKQEKFQDDKRKHTSLSIDVNK